MCVTAPSAAFGLEKAAVVIFLLCVLSRPGVRFSLRVARSPLAFGDQAMPGFSLASKSIPTSVSERSSSKIGQVRAAQLSQRRDRLCSSGHEVVSAERLHGQYFHWTEIAPEAATDLPDDNAIACDRLSATATAESTIRAKQNRRTGNWPLT